jgi:hypothetical protein
MMVENWSFGSSKGENKKLWTEAARTLYSTGPCLPEKGNLGEVLAAHSFVFCCDQFRRSNEGNTSYMRFSVPL